MSPAAFLSHGTGVRIPVPVPSFPRQKPERASDGTPTFAKPLATLAGYDTGLSANVSNRLNEHNAARIRTRRPSLPPLVRQQRYEARQISSFVGRAPLPARPNTRLPPRPHGRLAVSRRDDFDVTQIDPAC